MLRDWIGKKGMLHIIGLSHNAQLRKHGEQPNEAQFTFQKCLQTSIDLLRPQFIAEEANEECLAEQSKWSIAAELAAKNGISHRFCDPNDTERQRIGYHSAMPILNALMGDRSGLSDQELSLKAQAIEVGRYFPLRENFGLIVWPTFWVTMGYSYVATAMSMALLSCSMTIRLVGKS